MANVGAPDPLFEVDEAVPVAVPKAPAGESKTFRRYDQAQCFLLPPSLDDWLDEDDEARFVSEVVEDLLDLSPIYASYESASGAPPYDPRMMLKLLLYGYATGVTSSREIERRCRRDVAFRWLAANEAPDYRSISRFRRRHLDALRPLFLQVLALCAEAGLVRLGRVALDGTKLIANASKHKAMSYDRITPKIEQLQAEVDALLAEAEATDDAEDQAFGEDHRGDEVAPELARREGRLHKLRQAKEAIEAEARRKAEAAARKKAEAAGKPEGEAAAAASEAGQKAKPKGSAQRSFTDPEARMMKTGNGFRYAFNGQAVVDEDHQVVLAAEVTQQASDVNQLVPMVEATAENLEAAGVSGSPTTLLADAGYCSEDNLEAADDLAPDVLAATGRQRHGEQFPAPRGPIPKGATRREKMARRLRTKRGRADYKRRKAIVEPAFGQVKVRQHAGELRLRGLAGAQGEWTLHMLCHNLRKLRVAGGTTLLTPR
ncbi:MAG: IS1182 family transposase [Acidimicrobiales bacterium]